METCDWGRRLRHEEGILEPCDQEPTGTLVLIGANMQLALCTPHLSTLQEMGVSMSRPEDN